MARRLLRLGVVWFGLLAPPVCPCAAVTAAADARSPAAAVARDDASPACSACRTSRAQEERGRPCGDGGDCGCSGHGAANLVPAPAGGNVPSAPLAFLPLSPAGLADCPREHAGARRARHAPRSPSRSLTIRLRTLLI